MRTFVFVIAILAFSCSHEQAPTASSGTDEGYTVYLEAMKKSGVVSHLTYPDIAKVFDNYGTPLGEKAVWHYGTEGEAQ